MADIDLKTETPDTSIDDDAFLFGADSQASASPAVYSVQTVREHIVSFPNLFTTAQTFHPVTDVSAITARRYDAGSTANILQLQDQSNGILTFFDKDGALNLNGSTSGTVTIKPAATAGTYTLTLPENDGDSGQALLTDGAGVLSWGAVGGTPGGSDTQVQFNDGGSFGGDAGLTFNKTSKAITLGGATVTTSSPVIDAAQTWDDGGVTFTGLKFNATDTASAAGSLLMDLQVGSTSIFAVRRADFSGTKFNRAVVVLPQFSYFAGGAGPTVYFGATEATPTTQIANGVAASSLGSLAFSSSSTSVAAGTNDTILTRRAAANLRFGAADAAAPVAQTLSVQSVVAGTTNTAGANLTITGSQGTGTGAGGSIVFQVAPAGTTGTAQNALADAVTINANRSVNFAHSILIGRAGFTQIASINAGTYNGELGFGPASVATSGFALYVNNNSRAAVVRSDGYFGFAANTTNDGNSTIDTIIVRDAANTLAQRNGAVAQESRVYGSYTSDTNFQRMSIKTLRESSGALSGATYVTTIAIPAYANLIGVTTRVTTEVTGATTYDVGDGSDVDLWGAAIGIALGSQSRTADFTAVAAVGAAATSRTVTLTANGSNFTGGVVEICLHYLTTEAD
jgi:hypothetical protein